MQHCLWGPKNYNKLQPLSILLQIVFRLGQVPHIPQKKKTLEITAARFYRPDDAIRVAQSTVSEQ